MACLLTLTSNFVAPLIVPQWSECCDHNYVSILLLIVATLPRQSA